MTLTRRLSLDAEAFFLDGEEDEEPRVRRDEGGGDEGVVGLGRRGDEDGDGDGGKRTMPT